MTADFESKQIDLAREADFQLGQLQVRPSTRQVESGGKSETLQPRIMQVLVALARKRGQVVSRDELIEACWEGRAVGEDALNRCTQHIRKLGETSGAFRLETIPRVGYRLWVEEGARTESGAAQPGVAEVPKVTKVPAWLTLPALSGAAILAIIAAAAIWLGIANSRVVNVSAQVLTMAVLKLDTPPGDPEIERFAAAVSATIHSELARDHRVVNLAQSTSLTASQKPQAGRLLGVRALIDGTVSREGDAVRVGIRLDHGLRGLTIWSGTIDGRLDEPGAVASRINAQLRQKLSMNGFVILLVSDDPRDPERARAWFRVIQQSDEGNDRAAMRAAEEFAALWPESAAPQFMVTIETMDALPMLSDEERVKAFRRASDAADRANKLGLPGETGFVTDGPEVARARTTPAYAWAERIDRFENKLRSGPGTPIQDYMNTGRVKLALTRMGSELQNGKSTLIGRAEAYLAAGQPDLAAGDLDRGASIYPTHWRFPQLRFESAAWSPDEAEALLAAPGAWRVTNEQRQLLTNFLAARRAPDAQHIGIVADQCRSAAFRRDDDLFYCFSALARLGQTKEAFDVATILFPELRPQPGDDPDAPRWLLAPAASWTPIVLYAPWTKNLRADPQIIPVFERLGLLDYWRESKNWPDFCETGVEPASAKVCEQMKAGG